MLKKQLIRVKQKIVKQTTLVLGIERSTNHAKRQFLESIYQEQTTNIPREEAMILITNTCIRLREVWKACGSKEVWEIIDDGGENNSKERL